MESVNFGGDNPQPRFGHTICVIAPNKIALFGGAVGDTGRYVITGDVYIGDMTTKKWKRIEASGSVPTNRAAHQALAIELNQMIIFGGAVGGGGLADDNLYVFELRDDTGTWVTVPVIGTTPGRRYGHTMVLIKPHLIVFGGNTGQEPVNDVWSFNLEKSPYSWQKLECSSEQPNVRVYHSAALCTTGSANGMMVAFGGRTNDQGALNDTWGLRKHRDGRWDWVRAPYRNQTEQPLQRYQHSTLFLGTLMMVIGGRSNNVGETLPFEIYDTETSDWYKFQAIQRFRHSSWLIDQFLYLHGGFDSDQPNIPTEGILRLNLNTRFAQTPQLLRQMNTLRTDQSFTQSFNPRPPTNQTQTQDQFRRTNQQQPQARNQNNNQQVRVSSATNKNIRLANQAIVAMTYGPEEDITNQVKKVPIDKLQDEHKKLGAGFHDPNSQNKSQFLDQLCQPFVQNLLIPKDYQSIPPNSNLLTGIRKEMIIKLCDEVQRVLDKEPIVLRLRRPIKIYGNLNGQFLDLMRFFDHFKAPYDNLYNGDIDSQDYLFLGDYVDRGTRSLEIVLLLFTLKLKYADQIHLLRGHHEDAKINKIYGFADECFLKFAEDIMDPNSIYQRINRVFQYLPLAAVIEDKILCVHGGIGQTMRTVDEIELIQRPLEIVHDPKTIALELLWSDPCLSEEELENQPNPERDIFQNRQIIRFGTNRVSKFLQENNLNIIIRSHEPTQEGFERQNNNVITVFSCPDYGPNSQNNKGSMLTISKRGEIIPKVILPANSTSESRWMDLEEAIQRKKGFAKYVVIDNDELQWRKRQFTPPRSKKSQSQKQFA
ncbi:unnamed protein product (macronuclear) [Paramecium tetraurelia]|uniref:Serine/threonine specific protein phosphatases domain-containing protein n=1 Tax=Paramecium tetraurelia TaxID=5888 RepID=A0D8P1_PARTE|nr:uncharacterized protein GSPATT00014354001 [Paramecium tetraurelia]CAK79408.1 unnamed protein product [Paramecium tetraurelia]|eukprot:XP_001446805.1 hypothetical protein (macronuclear) [Paramecium tetraurelia strain d4-2]